MGGRTIGVVGPLAPYLQGLEADIVGRGYVSQTVRQLGSLMAHTGRWLVVQGLAGEDLTAVRVEQFLWERRAAGWGSRVSTSGIAPVLRYLRSVGAVPVPEPTGVDDPAAAVIEGYRWYLLGERVCRRTRCAFTWRGRTGSSLTWTSPIAPRTRS